MRSPCFTNFEYNSSDNNKTKTNIEYNTNDNSKNKYKVILNSNKANILKNKMSTPIYFKSCNKMNLKTIIDEKDKKTIEGNNKTSTIFFDRKCNRLRHHYKTPFNFEVLNHFLVLLY